MRDYIDLLELFCACTKAQISSLRAGDTAADPVWLCLQMKYPDLHLSEARSSRGGAPAAGEGYGHHGFCSAKEAQQRKQMMIHRTLPKFSFHHIDAEGVKPAQDHTGSQSKPGSRARSADEGLISAFLQFQKKMHAILQRWREILQIQGKKAQKQRSRRRRRISRKHKDLPQTHTEDDMPSFPVWMDAILPQQEVKKPPLQQQA